MKNRPVRVGRGVPIVTRLGVKYWRPTPRGASMEVLNRHAVREDPRTSTDWTTIGARIIEAATIASAVHMEELALAARNKQSASDWWDRDMYDGNG